jgi:hypothetical protein
MPLDYQSASLPHLSEKLWGEYENNERAVPDFEQSVLEKARDDYGRGNISADQSRSQVHEELKRRPEAEAEAFKANLSAASPSYGSALTSLGMGAGMGYLMDHAMRVGNLFGGEHKPSSYLSHVGNQITGGVTGITGMANKNMGLLRFLPLAFMAQHYGTQALANPEYQRGEKGYLSSLGSTIANAGDSTRKSMEEANDRYGTLGAMPLHALNIAMDPLGAGLAGISKGKELLFGKSSEQLLKRAMSAWRTPVNLKALAARMGLSEHPMMQAYASPQAKTYGGTPPKATAPGRGSAIHAISGALQGAVPTEEGLRQSEACSFSRLAKKPVESSNYVRGQNKVDSNAEGLLAWRNSPVPRIGGQDRVVSYMARPSNLYLSNSPSQDTKERHLGFPGTYGRYESGFSESARLPAATAWFDHMGLDHHPKRNSMNQEMSAAVANVPADQKHQAVQAEVRKRISDLGTTEAPQTGFPTTEWKPGMDFYGSNEAMALRQKAQPDFYVNKKQLNTLKVPLDSVDPKRLAAMHASYSQPAW